MVPSRTSRPRRRLPRHLRRRALPPLPEIDRSPFHGRPCRKQPRTTSSEPPGRAGRERRSRRVSRRCRFPTAASRTGRPTTTRHRDQRWRSEPAFAGSERDSGRSGARHRSGNHRGLSTAAAGHLGSAAGRGRSCDVGRRRSIPRRAVRSAALGLSGDVVRVSRSRWRRNIS